MSQGLRIKIPPIASKLQKAISPTHTTPILLQQLHLANENRESNKIARPKLFEPVELVEEREKKPVVRFGAITIIFIESRQSSHLH